MRSRVHISSKILIGLVGLMFAVCPMIWAQQTSIPGLHHRSAQGDQGTTNTGDLSSQDSSKQGISTLPKDVSGSYAFDHDNESVEIDIERNKLSGYISRLGDAETDVNTPLTFFFDQSSAVGDQIEFQTRVVHGVWYSFHGTILRGGGKTRADADYYLLHGVLQEHHPQNRRNKSASETIENRVVNFKSLGR